MDKEKNIDPLVSIQQELCDIWGITKYIFYYDESNNCRKFLVFDDSKQKFNTDYTADFVLAGLVKKEGDIVDVSHETFRKPLKLQGKVEGIKFSKLYAKGDFLQCVREKCIFEKLSWIDKSPFYIHYINVNNGKKAEDEATARAYAVYASAIFVKRNIENIWSCFASDEFEEYC